MRWQRLRGIFPPSGGTIGIFPNSSARTNAGTMGVTHSTHHAPPGQESTLKERLHLFKRQATTGDTPFHRAVRSSSSDAAARRRLEGLCEAALQHHAELQHLEDGVRRVPLAAARPHWAQLCISGGVLPLTDEGEARSVGAGADPADLLRALLDLQNHKVRWAGEGMGQGERCSPAACSHLSFSRVGAPLADSTRSECVAAAAPSAAVSGR